MNFLLRLLQSLFGGGQQRTPEPPQTRAPQPSPPQPPTEPAPSPESENGPSLSDLISSAQPAAPEETTPQPTPAPEPEPAPPPAPEPPMPEEVLQMTTANLTVQRIQLGCVDFDVSPDACNAYTAAVSDITDLAHDQLTDKADRFEPTYLPSNVETVTVKHVQAALKALGFFPGGETDGICGYRTRAAMRLYQEYVRTMDGFGDVVPDGVYGPTTHKHLVRRLQLGQTPNWRQAPQDHDRWIDLLSAAKQHHIASPDRFDILVDAFTGETDTRKLNDWVTTSDNAIHLIGVRREEFHNRYDDVFILLIKGLVFMFQGTTQTTIENRNEPGGMAFMASGQHDYQFAWHKRTYLALRPASFERGKGVLVARAGNDGVLSDAELAAHGLTSNYTINIHYGGVGGELLINTGGWTLGCQVINGGMYINPNGELIANASTIRPYGAYSLLADLVTALSGDMSTTTVTYTLLPESDLELSPDCAEVMRTARQKVMNQLGYD